MTLKHNTIFAYRATPARLLCALMLAALLPGCGKLADFQRAQAEYRRECTGDHSVRCRVMMVDVGIAKLDVALDMIEKDEERIVGCRGQAGFDAALALVEEKIAHYEDMKPNLFMRIFLSGTQVEFEQTPFKRERELDAFMAAMNECGEGKPEAAVAPAAATPESAAPASPAGGAALQGTIDANAPEVGEAVDTVAGRLARTELENGMRALTLNGKVLFGGDDANWQSPLRVFKLSQDREAILVGSTGGRGNSCESLYFFLVAGRQGVAPTPLFGTCSPVGSFAQEGDRITLTLPKMGGNTVVVFDGASLTEDGSPVVLNEGNDPSK